MKILQILILIFFINAIQIFSQFNSQYELINIPDNLIYKIGSAELIKEINEKASLLNKGQTEKIETIIYTSEFPSEQELSNLEQLGVGLNISSWVPPVKNHPLGFFIAEIPVNNFLNVLVRSEIKKIDVAADLSFPQNNEGSKKIGADKVWLNGYTGNGVKIAILDSGLDIDFSGTDLPSNIQMKDYSNYPALDDNIQNIVTGHGTHVTGSVLSRGFLSGSNIANGGGAYKGIAPNAELIFLKIGNDVNGGAKTSAIIEGMRAAVNIYNVDIITMSYGSWDIYHDGSNVKDQIVDWCYSQGVPVFIPSGNEGNTKRHFSGFLAANDSSELIRVEVNDAIANSTYLAFNLIWSDGSERKNLTLKYYNSLGEEISSVYHWANTESIRGTESHISQTLFTAPAGISVYYLRVFNLSESPQEFHLYEHFKDGKITFTDYNPNYTIISPATADFAFCVGSFVSRMEWTSYNGVSHTNYYGDEEGFVSCFSSRGPRIDGLQKPDIVAPGSSIISLMDQDVYTIPDSFSVDDDGNLGGDVKYIVMEGTSMAAPFCAGAAALYLEKYPNATPEDLYDALRNNAVRDQITENFPSPAYGYGKLDIYSATENLPPLPVELSSFTAEIKNGFVELHWKTETEVNNYGFEIEKLIREDWEKIGFIHGNGNSSSPKYYSYLDKNLPAGRQGISPEKISYRLKQLDSDGKYSYSKVIEVEYDLPKEFILYQNFPNPFNPVTRIKYAVPRESFVRITLYNLIGEKINELVNKGHQPGVYEVDLNGADLASGIYIYKLEVIEKGAVLSFTKKMILNK